MTKTHKNVSDEIIASAEADTHPKAMSDASSTTARGNGAEHAGAFQMATDQSPLDYRVASLEKRLKDLEALTMHWQAIYAWPVPWQTSGNPAPTEPPAEPEVQ